MLSKQVVQRASSVGVTFLVITGTDLGALIIGISGELLLHMNDLLLPLAIARLTASLTDSILGGYIQAQFKCYLCNEQTADRYHCNTKSKLISGSKWIDNDAVNFINTIVGANVAYFLWMNYG